MNNYYKQINLVEDLNRSSFLNELLKKELSYICENKNICNESLNLVKNYISENDTEIQCGVFIINNSNTDTLNIGGKDKPNSRERQKHDGKTSIKRLLRRMGVESAASAAPKKDKEMEVAI